MYRLIEPLEDGTPVQYVGVYVLRWRSEWGEPRVGFAEVEEDGEWWRIRETDVHAMREALTSGDVSRALYLLDTGLHVTTQEARDDHD